MFHEITDGVEAPEGYSDSGELWKDMRLPNLPGTKDPVPRSASDADGDTEGSEIETVTETELYVLTR